MTASPVFSPNGAAALRLSAPPTARAQLRDYAAFGGVLRSELEFPDLPAAGCCAQPDWMLSVSCLPPAAGAFSLVGERVVREEWYRLWRSPDALRLEYSHAGTFDITNAGSRIVWYDRSDMLVEIVRSIVLGPAMALALEMAGLLCLHGSAVCIGERAVAFVGPKYHGKSTLATALTAAGARLVGDDLLAVAPGPPALVRPGVASVRLWADMAEALPIADFSSTLIPGIKTTVAGIEERALAPAAAPLAGVYVLSPVKNGPRSPAVRRARLSPLEATIALAQQTKLADSLVGYRAAGAQLAVAAALAATVPVWTLHPERDISRLGQVVAQVLEWNSDA